jgi:MSHA pilin protein MshC
MQKSHQQHGVTLIELVVVIFILGIFSAVVALSWPSRQINTTADAQKVAADLRYIQNRAVTEDQRLRVNLSSTQYTFTALGGSTAVNHPATNTNIATLGTGTTMTWTNLPNNYLVFDEEGTPYTNNAVPGTKLATAATITLTNDGKLTRLTIEPNTGTVLNPVVV